MSGSDIEIIQDACSFIDLMIFDGTCTGVICIIFIYIIIIYIIFGIYIYKCVRLCLANSPARMLNVSPQPMFENLAFGLLNCTGES